MIWETGKFGQRRGRGGANHLQKRRTSLCMGISKVKAGPFERPIPARISLPDKELLPEAQRWLKHSGITVRKIAVTPEHQDTVILLLLSFPPHFCLFSQ